MLGAAAVSDRLTRVRSASIRVSFIGDRTTSTYKYEISDR